MIRARIAAALVVAAASSFVPPARACAPAPPAGETVRIVDEQALIAFDADRKVEHFVRRGQFDATSSEFGFLVPTPSPPELGEVDDAVFAKLAQRLEPKIERRYEGFSFEPSSLLLSMRGAGAPDAAGVEVLSLQRVAGLDAAVLAATDSAALSKWLDEHRYAKSGTLDAWLAVYVEKGWTITAFKIANDSAAKADRYALATKALRMTFATPAPFYPYREPADQRAPLPAGNKLAGQSRPRSLRVYYLANGRAAATLGKETPWPVKPILAEPVPPPFVASLGLPDYRNEQRWLTVFEDDTNPREGVDDVYFAVAQDATPISLPLKVVKSPRVISIPIELGPLVLLGAGWAWVRARRRKKAKQAAAPAG